MSSQSLWTKGPARGTFLESLESSWGEGISKRDWLKREEQKVWWKGKKKAKQTTIKIKSTFGMELRPLHSTLRIPSYCHWRLILFWASGREFFFLRNPLLNPITSFSPRRPCFSQWGQSSAQGFYSHVFFFCLLLSPFCCSFDCIFLWLHSTHLSLQSARMLLVWLIVLGALQICFPLRWGVEGFGLIRMNGRFF